MSIIDNLEKTDVGWDDEFDDELVWIAISLWSDNVIKKNFTPIANLNP